MTEKHSPGPWRVTDHTVRLDGRPGDYRQILDANGGFASNMVAHVCVAHKINADLNRTGEANARLIAAAPDLLETLRRAVFLYENYGLLAQPLQDDPLAAGRWVGEARAAIAKATEAA